MRGGMAYSNRVCAIAAPLPIPSMRPERVPFLFHDRRVGGPIMFA
jgi:hypothetical protein